MANVRSGGRDPLRPGMWPRGGGMATNGHGQRMTHGLASGLRRVVVDLCHRLLDSRERPYRPDLGDAGFIAVLASLTGSGASPDLREAGRLSLSGDLRGARARVAHHFRSRPTPRFFADIGQLNALAQRLETERPGPARDLLDRAERDCDSGLRVYAARTPPLAGGLDWERLAAGPGNDILYPVRPHRFGFAPRLAFAALHGRDTLAVLGTVLKGWMSRAASGRGRDPYVSNLVVIYRVLALSWTWALVAGHPDAAVHDDGDLEFTLLKILYADARHLAPRLGDSYPNNHLLADGFAAWYLATLFPGFLGPAQDWPLEGETLWLNELRRQVYGDGGSFEHSIHYHELVCEMTVAYVLLSRRNGVEPPAWVVQRLERMLALQAALAGPECAPLAIGNTTEDPLFPLDAGDGWASGALREVYRALFQPALSPAPDDDPTVARAFWMLGGEMAPPPADGVPGGADCAFPEAGLFVFAESDAGSRLVLRTGPAAGLPLSAGHMHADLLSVYLTLENAPVIVAPGTYSYRLEASDGDPAAAAIAAHLRSPEAHSGLVLAGENPLLPWTRGYGKKKDVPSRVVSRAVREDGVGAWAEGEVTGTTAYTGHRRGVVHVPGHYWLVYDLPPAAAAADGASIGWQVAPDAEITLDGGGAARVHAGGQVLRIIGSDGAGTPSVAAGQDVPPRGWVSESYGAVRPAPHLRFALQRTDAPAAFLLAPGTRADSVPPRIEVTAGDDGALGFCVVTGDDTDYVLLNPGGGDSPAAGWGIDFRGRLLWLRTRNGRPVEVRWIEGRGLSWPEHGLEIKAKGGASGIDLRQTAAGTEVRAGVGDELSILWDQAPRS